jgi:YfiH family protein
MRREEERHSAAGPEPWHLREEKGVRFLEYVGWPGARCLVSTRIGGTSRQPFDTLNLSYNVGDERFCVDTNVERFCAAAEIDRDRIIRTRQTHSSVVNLAAPVSSGLVGDGLATRVRNLWLAVTVADCLPVFVYDADNAAVAMVHTGWRGTLKEAPVECVRRMVVWFGSKASRLQALVGPGIGPCCFEVSSDLAGQFEKSFPGSSNGKHVDLSRANRLALERAGVRCVPGTAICTSCDEVNFFSHRRDGGTTGRMLALIALKP